MNYQICRVCFKKIHNYGLCDKCNEKYEILGNNTKTIVLRNSAYVHKEVKINVDGHKVIFLKSKLNGYEILYLY